MGKSKRRKPNRSHVKTQQPGRPRPTKGRSQPWLLWIGVSLTGILVAAVALLTWQANSGSTPDTAISAGGTPNLVVDQTNIDFGDVPVNQMVKASFKLSNTGDGQLSLDVPPAPEVVDGC